MFHLLCICFLCSRIHMSFMSLLAGHFPEESVLKCLSKGFSTGWLANLSAHLTWLFFLLNVKLCVCLLFSFSTRIYVPWEQRKLFLLVHCVSGGVRECPLPFCILSALCCGRWKHSKATMETPNLWPHSAPRGTLEDWRVLVYPGSWQCHFVPTGLLFLPQLTLLAHGDCVILCWFP